MADEDSIRNSLEALMLGDSTLRLRNDPEFASLVQSIMASVLSGDTTAELAILAETAKRGYEK